MKTRLLKLTLFGLCLLCLATVANGADSNVATSSTTDSVFGPLLEALTVKYGWTVAVLTWIGVLRSLFKPTMTWIETVVKETPTTKDDEWLTRAESSKVYKAICWMFDYLASVKLGSQWKK